MSTVSFADKSGLALNTVKRWVKGLPPHPVSYLMLCLLLDCSPEDLLNKNFSSLCSIKGIHADSAGRVCGFNAFTFPKELDGDRFPSNSLIQLDKIYKYCNGFEQAFDTDAIKAEVFNRVSRIANAIAA